MIRKHFWSILLLLIIGVFAFRLSLGLSLFGDDWLVLYIFKYQVQHGNFASFPIDLVSYLSPYGPTYLLMGIIDKFFGLNPLPYFVISLITRSVATIALYALVFHLTKKRFSAFMASAFWAISEIGIESTNWVFNMNSYIGLGLFLTTMIFVLKYHETSKKHFFIISIPFFLLSVIAVPVRMHGAFIVLFLTEVFYLFSKWKGFSSLKDFVLANLIWFISFLILSRWGVFGSSTGNYETYIGKGIKENAAAIAQGRYDQFLLPLTTIGNMIYTDQYTNYIAIPRIIIKTNNLSWLRSFLGPMWVMFTALFVVMGSILVEHKKRKLFIIMSSGLMLGLILLTNIFVRNNTSLLSPSQIFATLIGGAFIIITTVLITITKQNNIKKGLLLGLFWLAGFAAIPLVFSALAEIPTSMRYMVLPGVSVPIIIGLLFAIPKNLSQKIWLIVLLIPLYFIQYSSTQLYFKNLLVSRSEGVSQKIWSNVLSKIPNMDPQKDYLFYFEPNATNGSIVRDVITFGFIPRMIFYEKSPNRPGALYGIENREQFRSAIKDGEKLKGFNWGIAKRIDIKNAFAFRLEEDNTLTDIKSEILYGSR